LFETIGLLDFAGVDLADVHSKPMLNEVVKGAILPTDNDFESG
jgi:hypothetical protein